MFDTNKLQETIAKAKKTMEEIRARQQGCLLVHNDNIPVTKEVLGDDIERIENIGFNSYVYLKMTPKKPIKKNLVEKKAQKKPLKEVKAPPVEIDIDFLHNLIKAEVILNLYKMDECEVRNFDYSNEWYGCSQHIKNIIDIQQEKHLQAIREFEDEKKHLIIGGIILSILTLCLGLVL